MRVLVLISKANRIRPSMEIFVRLLFTLIFVFCSYASIGADRKPIDEVDPAALNAETQKMKNPGSGMDFVWWIPPEFWQIVLTQDPSVPEAQVQQMIGVLRPYSVLAVVQADISPFGSFKFFDRDRVMAGLSVSIVREGGAISAISHLEASDPDLRIMLDQMKPVLAAAMGNIGQNFYFFPLPDTDSEGNRVASPYEKGTLRVRLSARDENLPSVLDIELPIDALFVPRICPNGKPAHVSWKFCPWNGEKLE